MINRDGWTTYNDHRISDGLYDDSPRTNNYFITDFYSLAYYCTNSNPSSRSDNDISSKPCPRTYMNAIAQFTIVIDTGTRIDNTRIAYDSVSIDNRTGHDDRAPT